MRTTIVLDDDLLKRAQQLTAIRAKRELIDVALRTLVRLHEQSSARAARQAALGRRPGRIEAGSHQCR